MSVPDEITLDTVGIILLVLKAAVDLLKGWFKK